MLVRSSVLIRNHHSVPSYASLDGHVTTQTREEKPNTTTNEETSKMATLQDDALEGEKQASTGETAASSSTRKIGGSKGHVEETIQGPLVQLWDALRWKMIPRCTGRYTCRDHALVSHLTPYELLASIGVGFQGDGNTAVPPQYAFQLEGRSDLILVLPLDKNEETGLITYVKKGEEDGEVTTHYVHTLNSPSGFQRKLRAIGIHSLAEENLLPKGKCI